MSNLSDLGSSDDIVDFAGSALGLMADISGAAAFLQLIGALTSSNDSETDLLNDIYAGMKDLSAQVAAGQWDATIDNIYKAFNQAYSIFIDLQDIASSSPTTAEAESYIVTCIDSVEDFAQTPDYWRFPLFSQAYIEVDNYTVEPTADATGNAFLYSLALPAFSLTIMYFLATVGALRPTTINDPDRMTVLNDCITRLTTVYNTVVAGNPVVGDTGNGDPAGIVGWPTQDPAYPAGAKDIAAELSTGFLTPPYLFAPWPFEFPWNLLGRHYGAVEQYSGASVIDKYPPFIDPQGQPLSISYPGYSLQTDSPAFAKLQFRIWQRKKQVFERIGFLALRNLINCLCQRTGQAPMGVPHYEDWSVRAVYSFLAPLSLPPSDSVLQYIGGFLDSTYPLPPAGSEYLGPRPWSLRKMLAGAAGW